MSHHPNCPYYRRSCRCTRHLKQPIPSPSEVAFHPSRSLYTPDPVPSYSTALDAIQSTRLIQQTFTRASNHLSKACDQAQRRVRFNSPQRLDTHNSTDGIYDTHERKHPKHPPSPPRSILRSPPQQPTIYILTFATDSIPNHPRNVRQLLDSQFPQRKQRTGDPPIPHLYTIDARPFNPPSTRLCAMYSGISPLIQDVVVQDRNARKAVEHAVAELLAFGARERRDRGTREVSMSVCCTAGTHRSVAIGERIAQGVKAEVQRVGVREGVKVVVRHVSRIKGRGDPF